MSMRSSASAARQQLYSRRLKRLEETQEIQVRSTHRRRKALTRSAVLTGFVMAMVVYPMMGTIAPHSSGLGSVPGVIVGEAPSTAHALLGAGPQLIASDLPLPAPDAESQALATMERPTVSHHLPDCDTTVELDHPNGELPDSALCEVRKGLYLRADAAIAFAELDERFEAEFGRGMCISSTYRTLGEQYAIKRTRGFLAATPGKSFHGWGLAFDLCGGDDRGDSKEWLENNGPAYGWINPDWAKTRIYEPWHWEYLPGTSQYDPYGNGGGSGGADSGGDTDSDSKDVPDTDPKPKDPVPDETPKPKTTPAPSPQPDPAPDSDPATSENA